MPTLNQTDYLRKQKRLNAKQPVDHVLISPETIARINAKMMLERERVATGYRTGHMKGTLYDPVLYTDAPMYQSQPAIVDLSHRLSAAYDKECERKQGKRYA